jgi:hypothetical protein
MDRDLISQLDAEPGDIVLAGAARLAADHHRDVADLVAHVAAIDARRLFAPAHTGLFGYCCRALRLSEGAAGNMVDTARAARRFPLILDLLRDGSINPTTVRVLSSSLSTDHHERLLRESIGRTKLEVQVIAARERPAPDVPTSLRRVSRVVERPASPDPGLFGGVSSSAGPAPVATDAAARPSPPTARPTVVPLAPARYSYKLTIDERMRQLLLEAKELAGHSVAAGDDLTVITSALELYVEKQLRHRFGLGRRKRRARQVKRGSRHISAAVAREVYARDGGACAFVGPDGVRCGSRHRLQLHHVKPWAVGGEATVANISLRCAAHNRYEADVYFARPDHLPTAGCDSSVHLERGSASP